MTVIFGKKLFRSGLLIRAEGIFSLPLHARIFGFCGWSRMDGAEAGIIACNVARNKGRFTGLVPVNVA